eukprot:6208668-Pleurochrysis_carterae.AAC.1
MAALPGQAIRARILHGGARRGGTSGGAARRGWWSSPLTAATQAARRGGRSLATTPHSGCSHACGRPSRRRGRAS